MSGFCKYEMMLLGHKIGLKVVTRSFPPYNNYLKSVNYFIYNVRFIQNVLNANTSQSRYSRQYIR